MKAVVEIMTKEGLKVITKTHENEKDLIDWLVKMSDNDNFVLGYLDNKTLAIGKLEIKNGQEKSL